MIRLTAENTPRKLYIAKVDENGDLLAGCVLKLVDEDGVTVARWTTTADAEYELSGIPAGVYTLIEEEAAEGYQIAENIVITVHEDDTVLHVTMQDEPVPAEKPDVPKTGDTARPELWLWLLIGSLIGLAVIGVVYAFGKKKK